MRVKTENRRQAIIDAARAVFHEVGYERASMAGISARIGGSKATLYNYFKSKEELFAAAMLEAIEEQGMPLLDLLTPEGTDLTKALREFGLAFVRFISMAKVLSVVRTAIAEGAHSGLGAMLYVRGPQRAWQEIEARLAQLMKAGLLRQADPGIAALHLKALLEAGVLEPALYGAPPCLDEATSVGRAVEVFLAAYGAPAA
ncbi:MAG TPA: TetR/AcrR family transcriptional regulator [Acidocella sp.]|nr:TetR/AcrR family transcriptional regulator [Acidocella sp.]